MKLATKALLCAFVVSVCFFVLTAVFPDPQKSYIYTSTFFAVAAVSFGLILTFLNVHLIPSRLKKPPKNASPDQDFSALLSDRMQRASEKNTLIAVLMMHLNSEDGLPDRVMQKAIRQELISVLHPEDITVIQDNGDFVILLNDIRQPESAALVAEKLLRVIAELTDIIVLRPVIGIGIYPGDGQSPDDILLSAEKAMYEAEDSGLKSYQFAHKIMESTE